MTNLYYFFGFIGIIWSFWSFYLNASEVKQNLKMANRYEGTEALETFEPPKWLNDAKEGDIFEVNGDYMIYVGQMGTKPYVLKAALDKTGLTKTKEPSFIEEYITGYTKFEYTAFSKSVAAGESRSVSEPINTMNLEDKTNIQRIKVEQLPVEEIDLQNGQIFQFSRTDFSANSPTAIVDRAMFKYMNPDAPPHFQNSKDWVFWCQYGRDILTHEVKVPSRLMMLLASGGI